MLWTELPIYEEEIEWASAWAALAVVGAGGRIDALRHDRDAWLDHLATGAVTMLAVPVERRELEAIRLRALIDGVTAAVCAGRITPDQLKACVEAHLHEISLVPATAQA